MCTELHVGVAREEAEEDDEEEDSDGDMEDDGGGVSQAWKGGMAERAAERFLRRKAENLNLQDLVYGRGGEERDDYDLEEVLSTVHCFTCLLYSINS